MANNDEMTIDEIMENKIIEVHTKEHLYEKGHNDQIQ